LFGEKKKEKKSKEIKRKKKNTNKMDVNSTSSTNVEDYTLSELMAIVGLEDLDDKNEILRQTNKYIAKFQKSDPTLSAFFTSVQGQLLQYFNIDDSDAVDATEGNEGIEGNEATDGSKQQQQQQRTSSSSSTSTKSKTKTKNTTNSSAASSVGVGVATKTDLDQIYPVGEKQTDDRYENEYLRQSDSNQTEKITERKQKIQVYGNQHVPMSREQLGVNDNFVVPVKQDSLNPNLQNTITRFVNLDSQFRQTGSGTESSSTNYTLDLSDRLNNTLSLCLYSYQIPNSWYVIDVTYKNTSFWISDHFQNVVVSIPPGNYSAAQFVVALNTAISAAGFTAAASTSTTDFVVYDSSNGKITLNLFGATYVPPSLDIGQEETFLESDATSLLNPFTVTTETKITFFDFSFSLQYDHYSCQKLGGGGGGAGGGYLNQTLGWIMGFRLPILPVQVNGNTGEAVLDLNGTKYLILVIDDYNQNHVNNGLVTITELSTSLKMPSYFSGLQPLLCPPGSERRNAALIAENNAAFLNQTITTTTTTTTTSSGNESGLLLAEKYYNYSSASYLTTPTLLPSAPRTLTQSQIYTINEINKNKHSAAGNFRPKAPTSSDIMAILPLKGGSASIPTGTLLAEFSGSLQQNVRTYFGPVNIDRMAIKLLDDKGNILNLNGGDWCVTLIATCLYQY
jgi:hypothetical protein